MSITLSPKPKVPTKPPCPSNECKKCNIRAIERASWRIQKLMFAQKIQWARTWVLRHNETRFMNVNKAPTSGGRGESAEDGRGRERSGKDCMCKWKWFLASSVYIGLKQPVLKPIHPTTSKKIHTKAQNLRHKQPAQNYTCTELPYHLHNIGQQKSEPRSSKSTTSLPGSIYS